MSTLVHFHCVWSPGVRAFVFTVAGQRWELSPAGLADLVRQGRRQLADPLPYPQEFRLDAPGGGGQRFSGTDAGTFHALIDYLDAVHTSWTHWAGGGEG